MFKIFRKHFGIQVIICWSASPKTIYSVYLVIVLLYFCNKIQIAYCRNSIPNNMWLQTELGIDRIAYASSPQHQLCIKLTRSAGISQISMVSLEGRRRCVRVNDLPSDIYSAIYCKWFYEVNNLVNLLHIVICRIFDRLQELWRLFIV